MPTFTLYNVDHTHLMSTTPNIQEINWRLLIKMAGKKMSGEKRRNKENRPPQKKRKPAKRPTKLRGWTNEAMVRAMDAVKSGEMGVNRAALEHGVPRTSLKDRLAGRVVHGTKMGPKPYLTDAEEKELYEFLVNCSKMGYGKTRAEVLKIVEATMKKKGKKLEGPISQGWWCRFRERWPNLSLRKGDGFGVAREKMTTREVFKSYFDLLEKTLDEHGLKDKPAQIYNCDESGMPLEHKLPRVVSAKGTKKVRQISSGNKAQITVLGCGSATGQVIPPMVVFSGKKFNHELTVGEVPGTLYGMSDSGWMDSELFANWFSSHFLKHAVASRPLLLMLDGHKSHYTLDLVQTAAENGVIIFCLPPHTTADSQPLDTSCFGPLKVYWSEACREFMFTNAGRVVSKFQFSRLFSKAWSKGMTINNIVSGFRSTGIYPFNPEAILKKVPDSDPSSSGETRTFCGDDVQPPGESGDSSNGCDFSPETLERFETRYENGYDIFSDKEYVAWLQVYHPEDAPTDVPSSCGATRTSDGDELAHGESADSSSEDETPAQDGFNGNFDRFVVVYEGGDDDCYDEDYLVWIQRNHPEEYPTFMNIFSSVTPLEDQSGSCDASFTGSSMFDGKFTWFVLVLNFCVL